MERYSGVAWAVSEAEESGAISNGAWDGDGHSSRDGGGMEIAGQRPSKRAGEGGVEAGWTGRFSHRGRVLGQTPKGRFDLPSVRVRAKTGGGNRPPGSLTFLPRATFTYCVNVVAAPRPGGHYVAG